MINNIAVKKNRVTPRIAILIVNYNTAESTIFMVKSANILKLLPDIIVLDNSQEANKLQNLEYDGSYKYFQTKFNYGYYGACAWYLEKYNDTDYDWIFIANSDIKFTDPNLFVNLTSDGLVDGIGQVGLYGPSVFSIARNIDQNPHRIKRPTISQVYKHWFFTSWYPFSYLYRFRENQSKNSHLDKTLTEKIPVEVFAVQGSFIGFHSRYFKQCHLPTETFLFWEEEIVAWQCAAVKLKVIYDPRVSLFHEEHKSFKGGYSLNKELFKIRHKSARIMLKYMNKIPISR